MKIKIMKILTSFFFFIFLCSVAFAGTLTEKAILEQGNLLIFELKEIKRIPNVPAGLSAETAYKLVTGEIMEFQIHEERERKNWKFTFPIKEEMKFSVMSFDQKTQKWNERTNVVSAMDWATTSFFLLITSLIFFVSFINQLTKTGDIKLLVFYLGILEGILAGALAGILAGVFVGALAGVSTVLFTGALAGKSIRIFGVEFVEFVEVFTGILAGWLAGEQGYKIIFCYLVPLVIMMAISFAVAKTASYVIRIFGDKKPNTG